MEVQQGMSRIDLLNHINITKNNLNTLVKNHQEYEYIHKKPLNFNWILHTVGFMIFVYVASMIFDFVTYPLGKLLGIEAVSDLAAYIFILLSLFLYVFLYVSYNKKVLIKKITSNKERIKLINEENNNLMFFFDYSTIIPRQYLNFHALNNFENYIETGRADTLKEAMNLYEQEVRHEQNMNEIRILQNLQEATYQRANEAATLGWVNLFTKR